jgi:hypothetical protein
MFERRTGSERDPSTSRKSIKIYIAGYIREVKIAFGLEDFVSEYKNLESLSIVFANCWRLSSVVNILAASPYSKNALTTEIAADPILLRQLSDNLCLT